MLYLIGYREPFRWRGDWSPSASYQVNDLVYYASATYVCIKDNTNKAPSTNPEYWDEMIFVGDIDCGTWS